MHTIRHKAHRAAWQTDEGSVNYNPFARQRSRTVSDAENRLHRSRSEATVQQTIEEQRQNEGKEALRDFGHPHHADTAPSEYPASVDVEKTPASPVTADYGSAAPNAASGERASASDTTAVNGAPASTTHKRKGLKAMFAKHHTDDSEAPAYVDGEEHSFEERKKRSLKKKIPVGAQLRAALIGSKINVLLIFVPVGFAMYYAHMSPVLIFVMNFIAIIPLAAMLSYATEELAIRVGETFGGLLNASFGNAVELIVSVQALVKGEITIVKTSLIGSMLSNLLLVLGMAFYLGGLNRIEQHFNVTVAQTASSLLALCIASLIIPTVFHNMLVEENADDGKRNQELSRGTALILLGVYGCYLLFQLKSHVSMYNEPSKKSPKKKTKVEEGGAHRGIATIGAGTAAVAGGGVNATRLLKSTEEEEDDEIEEPELSVIGALLTLTFSTTLVAFCSEFMVSSIQGITKGGQVSTTFVGLILLPIVGNAAEHATAVTVAIKDKMDLAIGVAIGSSMQIALLVLPFIVVLGWILGDDCMTLYFDTFQIATLFVAVLLVNYLIQDGKSHWLEGVLLIASYVIIALAAFFYPNLPEGTCR